MKSRDSTSGIPVFMPERTKIGDFSTSKKRYPILLSIDL